jgi:hypothetical protein
LCSHRKISTSKGHNVTHTYSTLSFQFKYVI